ncbi:MAG: DUF4392 domain-containing protein [Nitrososphaeria archaeon]|nr:DUF4392 domain-containing protein [Nitrososphaeria archaeon]NIQ33789.1 DUF4392 domain-containing protein [Nitrososphaeria archaeon]
MSDEISWPEDIVEMVDEVVGDNLDKLMLIDTRGWAITDRLYEAARRVVGGPLTLTAAQRLMEILEPGSPVVLNCGFPIMPWGIHAETDGVVASAAFARAFNLVFKAKPIILSEEETVPVAKATVRAAGLHAVDDFETCQRLPHSAAVLPFTKDTSKSKKEAEKFLNSIKPVAAIAIERPGRNDSGYYHSGIGRDITPLVAKVDDVFAGVSDRGGVTVGIGDQGNELGLGAIREAIRKYHAFGSKCLEEDCCGEGFTCTVDADVTVITSVSDWGAYGVIACLDMLHRDVNLGDSVLHSGEVEKRMIRACIDSGGIDGPSGNLDYRIDGVKEDYHARLIEMMRDIIDYPYKVFMTDIVGYGAHSIYKPHYEHSARLRKDSSL